MKMSKLPRDLAEEVLCRVPLTSMRRVRSSCKKWNNLCKGGSFAKKHLGRDQAASKVVMMMDYRIYLMSINLDNEVIKPEAKLISVYDSDEVDVSQVFHCEGLLLCITKDTARLVVWNPYWGQTRWIEATHNFHILDRYKYALGYDKSKSHKILRFIRFFGTAFVEFKIYDLNSDSWRVLVDVTQDDFNIEFHDLGVTLKGNTYWFAKEMISETKEGEHSFLVCFDFTRERFGPRLPVPFQWFSEDTVCLSSVREEQLAVLFQRWDTLQMEIWVTTKIEPDAVWWSSKVFLAVYMRPTCFPFQFSIIGVSFFIDEEKKVALVFDKSRDWKNPIRNNVACIVGVDGSLKQVNLGESAYKRCYPLVCSYLPSLLHP